jgi:dolichol kinase
MLDFIGLIKYSLPLLLFVQFNPWLESWQSRKVLHIGTGTLYIYSDLSNDYVRYGIYIVSLVNIIGLTTMQTFHFADLKDKGIISYLAICALVAYLQIPFVNIAPMFYADPFGAIVGRMTTSAKLVGSKSVNGTLAVGVVAFATLFYTPLTQRIFHSFMIAMIELFSRKWDNPMIGMYLLLKYALN